MPSEMSIVPSLFASADSLHDKVAGVPRKRKPKMAIPSEMSVVPLLFGSPRWKAPGSHSPGARDGSDGLVPALLEVVDGLLPHRPRELEPILHGDHRALSWIPVAEALEAL